MSDAEDFRLNDPDLRVHEADEPRPRPVGAPLPVGTGPQSPLPGDAHRLSSAPPPGRALTGSSPADAPLDLASSLQRAFSALRSALPFVHRILPLLAGNVGTAVSNLLPPHPEFFHSGCGRDSSESTFRLMSPSHRQALAWNELVCAAVPVSP